MNTFAPTTAEALRAALASTIACSAQELQEAVGQVVVATAAECPAAGPDDRSLSDPATRTLVLLADRIPEGQEAQALAEAIERHYGRQAAQLVFGERASDLLGSEGKMIKNGNIVTAQRAYVSIAQVGEIGVVVDAPTSMRCHPGALVLITTGGYIVIDEEAVKTTGRYLDGATFETCNAARLCGALGQALIDGKLSNYIEPTGASTEGDKTIQAHLLEACKHKIALHVDAAIDVVDSDSVEAESWAYEAGKEAWDFDLKAPEKLVPYPLLTSAFKRGFDSVEQASPKREVHGNVANYTPTELRVAQSNPGYDRADVQAVAGLRSSLLRRADGDVQHLAVNAAELELIRDALASHRELLASPTSADRDANGDGWADKQVQACDALLADLAAPAKAQDDSPSPGM